MADRDEWQRYLVELDTALARAEELVAENPSNNGGRPANRDARASERVLSDPALGVGAPPANVTIPEDLVDYAKDISVRQGRVTRMLSEAMDDVAGQLDAMAPRHARPDSGPVYLDTQG
ncbi:hypothetical protein [Jonesia quinghaiensis]|uniref:hypothetical protein n=1 Tax=Jonesia quinghaiensis TaxID=262806 RepID=UPI0004921F2B|nr:hypothetical protein [Jonesia quinghaiensis]